VIDPHTVELMNLEIDGALDAEKKESLREALERDPQARQMYADLRSVVSVMETELRVDPPESLQAEIVAAVAASKVVPFERASNRSRFLPLRIAAAIAAGLLAVFLLKPEVFDGISVPDLRGTMGRRAVHRPVTASVVPSSDPSALTSVKIDLDGSVAGSIEVRFDPRAVQLQEVEGRRAAVNSVTPGTATIVRARPPAIILVFRRLTGERSQVAIRATENGKEPYDLEVVLPATN